MKSSQERSHDEKSFEDDILLMVLDKAERHQPFDIAYAYELEQRGWVRFFSARLIPPGNTRWLMFRLTRLGRRELAQYRKDRPQIIGPAS